MAIGFIFSVKSWATVEKHLAAKITSLARAFVERREKDSNYEFYRRNNNGQAFLHSCSENCHHTKRVKEAPLCAKTLETRDKKLLQIQ